MLKNSRDPELSLWQSAVDEVVAKSTAGSQAEDAGSAAVAARPDTSDNMVASAAVDVGAAEAGVTSGSSVLPGAPLLHESTEDVGQVVGYCSALARNIALDILRRNPTGAGVNKQELTARMGVCDPRWVEAIVKYTEFKRSRQAVPYRVYKNLSDFVIDGALPAKARIAIVGDWGTGQNEAKQVLAQIARKKPDIVIHLGDIYYSGTDFEVDSYFYNIWSSELDLSKVRTFTMSGNHDMFSGGAPYYRLLDKLGQPASYFCLRNDKWQFVAMDTGLNDRVPGGTVPTFLEDSEVAWLADKVKNAGGRRTVLLSHHQLFSAFEDVGGGSTNAHLLSQVSELLPYVDAWLWGHEHTLTIYEKYQNVLARCIGHGAFPVGLGEVHPPKFSGVPFNRDVTLGQGSAFLNHGYAIMDIDGDAAGISYFEDTDEDDPTFTEKL